MIILKINILSVSTLVDVEITSCRAVSYTHLDVYKRQVK